MQHPADSNEKVAPGAQVLALGAMWQEATSFHLEIPPIDDVEPEVLSNCTEYSRCRLPPAVLLALRSEDQILPGGVLNMPSSSNTFWPQAG